MGEFQLRLTSQVEDPILIFYQPDNAAGLIVIKRFWHGARGARPTWLLDRFGRNRAISAAARDKILGGVAKLNV
jgi:hypothetical protein